MTGNGELTQLAREILGKVRNELLSFALEMLDIKSPMIDEFWKEGDRDDPNLSFMYPHINAYSISTNKDMWVDEKIIIEHIWDALQKSSRIFTIKVKDWEIEGYFRGFRKLNDYEIEDESCCNYFALGKKKAKIDGYNIVLCIIWIFVDTLCSESSCTCRGIVTILGGVLEIDGKPVKYVELLDRVEVEGGFLCT